MVTIQKVSGLKCIEISLNESMEAIQMHVMYVMCAALTYSILVYVLKCLHYFFNLTSM